MNLIQSFWCEIQILDAQQKISHKLSISLSEKLNLKGRKRGAPPSTCLEVPERRSGFQKTSGAPLRRAPAQFKHWVEL